MFLTNVGGENMFAQNLRYLRESHNMEQIELAERLGKKSSSTISEWEKGKYTPRIGVLNDISEIFKVSISDLMNTDLSNQNSSIDNDHMNLFAQLDNSRKIKVNSFAQKQLEEQLKNKIVELPKRDDYVEDDLAAHLVDPTRKFTEEEIDGLKAYLSKAKEDYLNKNK